MICKALVGQLFVLAINRIKLRNLSLVTQNIKAIILNFVPTSGTFWRWVKSLDLDELCTTSNKCHTKRWVVLDCYWDSRYTTQDSRRESIKHHREETGTVAPVMVTESGVVTKWRNVIKEVLQWNLRIADTLGQQCCPLLRGCPYLEGYRGGHAPR